MLKCRDMAELVTHYLENDLPANTRFAVRLHLWMCGACRTYVDQMRRTREFLADMPPPPVSRDAESRIVDSLLNPSKSD